MADQIWEPDDPTQKPGAIQTPPTQPVTTPGAVSPGLDLSANFTPPSVSTDPKSGHIDAAVNNILGNLWSKYRLKGTLPNVPQATITQPDVGNALNNMTPTPKGAITPDNGIPGGSINSPENQKAVGAIQVIKGNPNLSEQENLIRGERSRTATMGPAPNPFGMSINDWNDLIRKHPETYGKLAAEYQTHLNTINAARDKEYTDALTNADKNALTAQYNADRTANYIANAEMKNDVAQKLAAIKGEQVSNQGVLWSALGGLYANKGIEALKHGNYWDRMPSGGGKGGNRVPKAPKVAYLTFGPNRPQGFYDLNNPDDAASYMNDLKYGKDFGDKYITGQDITGQVLGYNRGTGGAVAKQNATIREDNAALEAKRKKQAVTAQPAPKPAVTKPAGKTLDANTAQSFIKQAGGDKNKARALAKQAGYSF